MSTWATETLTNNWCDPPRDLENTNFVKEVYSDASDWMETYVVVEDDHITRGAQWKRETKEDIFIGEAEAFARGFIQEGEQTTYFVDNKALHWTIRKGHCACYPVNKILQSSLGLKRAHSRWISSKRNISDPFSRGVRIPPPNEPIGNWVLFEDADGDAPIAIASKEPPHRWYCVKPFDHLVDPTLLPSQHGSC